jgi:hypothetical protein
MAVMETVLLVRIDPDSVGVKRQVRSATGGFRRGSVVEVEVTKNGVTHWVECHVDRWMTGQLWVTEMAPAGAGGSFIHD